MTRERLIVVKRPDGGADFVPAHLYHRPVPAGPYIFGDISPYRSPVTREPITSRSRHREHLRETNCIEIGNEMPKQQAKPLPPVEADVKRAIEELKSR